MAKKKALADIEKSLTPKQAYLVWMDDTHKRFSSMKESVLKSDDEIHRIWKQIQKGIEARHQNAEERHQAIFKARQDFVFLQNLHIEANGLILREMEANALKGSLLAQKVFEILQQDTISNEINAVKGFLRYHVAYPLDRETADAVEHAIKHNVHTWTLLHEDDFDEWVFGFFVDAGKKSLTDDAYRLRREADDDEDDRPDAWMLIEKPDEEDVRALFEDDDAFADYLTKRDFSFGLADVRDAEVQSKLEAVEAAIRELIDAGTVREWTQVHLEIIPFRFLQSVPLVENKWIDRVVVELAEWGALLKAKGFRFDKDYDDDHFMMRLRIYRPSANKEDDAVADFEELQQVRMEVKSLLASFPGKTKKIAGRVHLRFADYRDWPDRQVKGKIWSEAGVVVASWNEWIDANGVDGVADLVGVKVGKLRPFGDRSDYAVFDDPETAFEKQRNREESFDRLTAWTISKAEAEGRDHIRSRLEDRLISRVFSLASFKTALAEWKALASAYIGEAYLTAFAVEQISKAFFDGQRVTYDNIEQIQEITIADLEKMVCLYNNMVKYRLWRYRETDLFTGEKPEDDECLPLQYRSGFHIDLDAIKQAIRPFVPKKVKEVTDMIKAELLRDAGREMEARSLIIPYVEGDDKRKVKDGK